MSNFASTVRQAVRGKQRLGEPEPSATAAANSDPDEGPAEATDQVADVATPIVPGDFVRLKRNPEQAGKLLPGEKKIAGTRMVEILFVNGKKRYVLYSALEPVPAEADDVSDLFARGQFVEPDWLRRTLTRLRVTGRLSEVVYSMEATETDFYAYQFKPVIKLMNSPTDALLIADEVGLGKTIEAGLVWTELRARLDCNRLLVACPKTLCQKWQDELAMRFGVDAQIGDAKTLLDALRRSRETGRGYAFVCSMQGLRPPRGWDEKSEGEDQPGHARRDLARFLDEASDGEPLIDLLVVDEAHHMRNPETLLHGFGRLANAVASHRLFLSATPIHLRNRDLHSLLKMVDPDTFEFERTLNELIETNAPILAARDLLLRTDALAPDILARIDEAKGHEILQGSKALKQIRKELDVTNLDRSKRSELAARLERVNQLANYVSRTRRRDVQEFTVIREPKAPVLEMHCDERVFYEEISKVVSEYARDRAANERFLLSTPQRLLTSSLAAASAYWSGIAATVADKKIEEIEESDRDLGDDVLDQRPLVGLIAQRARSIDMTARLKEVDTKYQLLLRELRRLWKTEADAKIIVFSSFIPTLKYLEDRFRKEQIGVELLHGKVKDRAGTLARFRTSESVQVLLSSEVGSEGVDLQFSAVVVNYDLPWNPMRLEQRIGRVDRLGQTKGKVTILNMVYDGTIDKRIYERLYKRLQIGARALGAMEAVLGKPIRELEMKLLDPTLSDRQKEEAIDRTAKALEIKRKIEEQLEAEAGALVHHGDYILERITESRGRRRWISGDDILTYVRGCVNRDFPGSVIEASPPGSDAYRITLSSKGLHAFRTYVAKNGVKDQTSIIYNNRGQRFRFTSSVVPKDNSVEYISQLHPLVRFCADLGDDTVRNPQSVAARVSAEKAKLLSECTPGLYVLAVRRWSSGNEQAGMTKVQIGYAGASVMTGELIGNDLAERMMAAVAQDGRPIPNASEHDGLDGASKTLTDVVGPELNRRFGEFVEQATAEIEDRVEIRKRSLDRHFKRKIPALSNHRDNLLRKATLAQENGDLRRATKLTNLARAQEAKEQKLRRAWELRSSELEAQRNAEPEFSDVACVFLQLDL